MPMRASVAALVAALPAFVTLAPCLADDGPLNPPAGPIVSTPGPEPRREINLANTPGDADSFFRITTSGSYYLPQSFAFSAGQIAGKSGIEIDADNVTIDLNGFTLAATPASLHAVRITPGRQRTSIVNGNLTLWGRGGITGEGSSSVLVEGVRIGGVSETAPGSAGIMLNSGSIIRDVSIESVSNNQAGIVTSNNCIIARTAVTASTAGGIVTGGMCEVIDSTAWALTGVGINVGSGSSVRGSSASLCTGTGIQIGDSSNPGGNVSHCRAFSNGNGGIYVGRGGVVTACEADSNTGTGIEALFGSVITACTSRANTVHGFLARDFSVITDCQAYLNTMNGIDCAFGGNQVVHCTSTANNQHGIQGSSDTTVRNCTCDNNSGGSGILINGSDAKVDGNTCTDNLRGIQVTAPGTLVVRNVCAGNTTNYDIVANNVVGIIVSSPLSGAIVGAAGGAGVGTTDSWANLSY